jgi:hypothetical protein
MLGGFELKILFVFADIFIVPGSSHLLDPPTPSGAFLDLETLRCTSLLEPSHLRLDILACEAGVHA